MKYSESKLLELDAEKIWIVAVGRSCREKTKVIEAGLWICNFEHIVPERHGVMVTFGNPGKKRKLSRKRKVRKKKKGRVGKKGEILQRWLFFGTNWTVLQSPTTRRQILKVKRRLLPGLESPRKMLERIESNRSLPKWWWWWESSQFINIIMEVQDNVIRASPNSTFSCTPYNHHHHQRYYLKGEPAEKLENRVKSTLLWRWGETARGDTVKSIQFPLLTMLTIVKAFLF